MDNQIIPDKALNFPNPKFVSFIKRMWNSEPISIEEKAGYNAATIHAPITIVDKIMLPTVVEQTDYELLNFQLPDFNDDFEIGIEAASSSSGSDFLTFKNGGAFSVDGIVATSGDILHFNFDINFFAGHEDSEKTSIRATVSWKNSRSTVAKVQNTGLSFHADGYSEFFADILFSEPAPDKMLKIGIDFDKIAGTHNLVIKYREGGNIPAGLLISQRYDIKRL